MRGPHAVRASLALLLACAAAPASAAVDDDAPPGAPEDRELWTRAHDRSTELLTRRAEAARLQRAAKDGGFDARLRAVADGGGPAADRAAALRARLLSTWTGSAELLLRPWPVDPTRGCRYAALNLEGVMHQREGRVKQAQLRGAREDVRACLDKAAVPIAALVRSNARLAAVLADAARLLAAAPPRIAAEREAAARVEPGR
jgi:hypothetical protein